MKYGFFYGNLLLVIAFTVVSVVRFLIFQRKLMKYLLEKQTEKWKELTTVLGFGPGYANSFRGLKFLFSKEYLGDPEVLRLKVIVRNSYIYTFIGMVAIFLAFWLLVVFCLK